jgi:hypothetical protein
MSKRSMIAIACAGLVLPLIGVFTPAQTPPTTRPAAEPADNSYCFVCHANYKQEFLAKSHEKVGVGCANCHGESDKHSSDENNITPPDTMYAKEKITVACMKCHPEADLIKAQKKMTEPLHASFLAGKFTDNKKWCIDCHGSHSLPVRTRQWDKISGKLIKDDGVRVVQPPKK